MKDAPARDAGWKELSARGPVTRGTIRHSKIENPK